MKPNVPHIVLGKQLSKGRGNIVGFDEVADHIDTDIPQVLLVVGPPAQLAVFFLLFLGLQQPLLQEGNQRIGPQAGLVFCFILPDGEPFPFDAASCDRVPDGNAVVVEVEGAPFQADDLAAAQAVEGGQKDYQLDLVSLDDLKQVQDLGIQVVVPFEGFGFGDDDPVGGVAGDQLFIHRIVQRPMDQGVIVLDGGWLDALQFLFIKGKNIVFGQVAEGNGMLPEVRGDRVVELLFVPRIGREFDGLAVHHPSGGGLVLILQPLIQEIHKGNLRGRLAPRRCRRNGLPCSRLLEQLFRPFLSDGGEHIVCPGLVALGFFVSGNPFGFSLAILIGKI